MANAKPARLTDEQKKPASSKPEIVYYGEGAEEIEFEVDPNAKLIRVYDNGIVLVDY